MSASGAKRTLSNQCLPISIYCHTRSTVSIATHDISVGPLGRVGRPPGGFGIRGFKDDDRRKLIRRAARGRQITASTLAKYLALRALDELHLPLDDPRMKAGGAHDELSFALHRHFGLRPWDDPAKFEDVAERLAQAAGVARLHPDGAYELT